MLEQVFRGVLPVAPSRDVTDERRAAEAVTALRADAGRFPGHYLIRPRLVGAWTRKR